LESPKLLSVTPHTQSFEFAGHGGRKMGISRDRSVRAIARNLRFGEPKLKKFKVKDFNVIENFVSGV